MYLHSQDMRVCILFILFASCTANPVVTLLSDHAGTVEVHSEVHPLFSRYLDDLSEVAGAVFDPGAIAVSLESLPVQNVFVQKEGWNYHVRFSFSDFASLVQAVEYQDFSFLTTDDHGQILLNLRASDISRFLNSYLDIGPFSSLLEYEGDTEEYLSRLQWAFSDYGSPEEVRQMMDTADILVDVRTPGPITALKGAEAVTDRRALYDISLLQLMQQPFPVEIRYALNP